jgi:hypothetical protein
MAHNKLPDHRIRPSLNAKAVPFEEKKIYLKFGIAALLFLWAYTSLVAQKNETAKPIWTLPSPNGWMAEGLHTYRKSAVSPTLNLVLSAHNKSGQLKTIDAGKGQFKTLFKFPALPPRAVFAAFNEKLWVADEKNLTAYSIYTGKRLLQKKIPDGNAFSVMTIGYNDAVFLIDHAKKQLFLYGDNVFTVLLEDPKLESAASLLLINGDLFIGTKTNVLNFNLRKKILSVYAENTGAVLSLEKDHLVHIVALTEDSIIRFLSKDKRAALLPNDANYVALSINSDGGKLLLLDKKGTISGFDYVKLTGESAQEWALRKSRKMQVFENSNLKLIGSEYIIHFNDADPEKREVYLEGFYPEKGKVENGELSPLTPGAKTMECAEKSYQAFVKWSQKVSVDFKNTVKHGVPPTFWLMVNDYTSIKEPLQNAQRHAKIWYWKRNPSVPGRYPGFWKWEAVLTQDGVCELPDEKEAGQYFKGFILSDKTQ